MGHRSAIEDAVGHGQRREIRRTLRIRRLPQDSAGRRVERGPRTSGDRFARRQRVGTALVVVPDRRVDPLPIIAVPHWMPPGSSPWPTSVLHRYSSVACIERPVDAALLADPDDARQRPVDARRNTFAPEPAKSQMLKVLARAGTRRRRAPHTELSERRALRRGTTTAAAPVRRSKAITELKCASSGKHASFQPSGCRRETRRDAGGLQVELTGGADTPGRSRDRSPEG